MVSQPGEDDRVVVLVIEIVPFSGFAKLRDKKRSWTLRPRQLVVKDFLTEEHTFRYGPSSWSTIMDTRSCLLVKTCLAMAHGLLQNGCR